MYRTIEVDLEDFDTDSLIDELENRGVTVHGQTGHDDNLRIMQEIYERRLCGRDYERQLDQLIWNTIGKM